MIRLKTYDDFQTILLLSDGPFSYIGTTSELNFETGQTVQWSAARIECQIMTVWVRPFRQLCRHFVEEVAA
jgi:hypothetical protein